MSRYFYSLLCFLSLFTRVAHSAEVKLYHHVDAHALVEKCHLLWDATLGDRAYRATVECMRQEIETQARITLRPKGWHEIYIEKDMFGKWFTARNTLFQMIPASCNPQGCVPPTPVQVDIELVREMAYLLSFLVYIRNLYHITPETFDSCVNHFCNEQVEHVE